METSNNLTCESEQGTFTTFSPVFLVVFSFTIIVVYITPKGIKKKLLSSEIKYVAQMIYFSATGI